MGNALGARREELEEASPPAIPAAGLTYNAELRPRILVAFRCGWWAPRALGCGERALTPSREEIDAKQEAFSERVTRRSGCG